jgi:glycosyltransferase involved in cell wall biosynthesis
MMIGPYPGSPSRIDGGAASAVTYLSQELSTRPDIELIGVRVADTTTVSTSGGGFDWPVINLPLARLGLATLYRRQVRYFDDLQKQYRPDIVHGQGIDLPGYIAVNSGRPSVVTVHGIVGEETRYGSGALARMRSFLNGRLIERSTVSRASDLISISPYVTEHYGSQIRGCVHDIPNPISRHYFEIERRPEKGRLLYAGRIIRRKGVVDLLRAFSSIKQPGAKLVCAGAATDPAYEQLVQQEVGRLELADRVEFLGLLDEHSMREEFARAEALVLPSYQETAPMVIQQAMAAGLLVIATRICGVPYQIQHDETGLLFTAGHVDELAALLHRTWTDNLLSERLGKAARSAAIERYHAARIAEATVAAYKAIIRRGAVSRSRAS